MKKSKIRALILLAVIALVITLGIFAVIRLLTKDIPDPAPPAPPKQPETFQFAGETYTAVDLPKSPYDTALFEERDGRLIYTDPETETFVGIDVSAHREQINWRAVKKDGIDFAIIRVGWRGNTEGHLYLDEYFHQNIRGALAAGLDVGVYFYSQAITEAEALAEAQAVLEWIDGYKITYPVVYDWEYVSADARTGNMDNAVLTDCAKIFCSTVEQAGYIPMVYFNLDIGYRRYDLQAISEYDFWLAEYDTAPTFFYEYHMLQYTSSGEVDGIEGGVDMNISFVDYAAQTAEKAKAED